MPHRRPSKAILLLLLALSTTTSLTSAGRAEEHANGTSPAPQKVEADGLHNVFRITPQLYSGNGPEGDDGFESLQKLGIKTVITVDGAQPDVKRAKEFGLRYVHIPIGYNGVPREKALQLAKAVRELPGPIYIHCHHGKHRGPAAAAVARLCADEQCHADEALALLKVAGTDPRYKGLFKSVLEFKRPTAQELAKLPANLPEAVKAAGLTQAMVVIDHSGDNLKLVQAAGWAAPPDHPDIDPPYEALQLVEGFAELSRLPDVEKRPEDFRKWLAEGLTGARELEQVLRTAKEKKTAAQEPAETAYRRVSAACTQCHAKYRDNP